MKALTEWAAAKASPSEQSAEAAEANPSIWNWASSTQSKEQLVTFRAGSCCGSKWPLRTASVRWTVVAGSVKLGKPMVAKVLARLEISPLV